MTTAGWDSEDASGHCEELVVIKELMLGSAARGGAWGALQSAGHIALMLRWFV